MVASVLYDQFLALNKDFEHNISHSGEFQGSIRKFRRRHQALCQSVKNADKFMMISNVAGFCCQIINLILIMYCTIFFRHQSISYSSLSAFTYISWLATLLSGLTLTASQGIVINHVVSHCVTLLCLFSMVGGNRAMLWFLYLSVCFICWVAAWYAHAELLSTGSISFPQVIMMLCWPFLAENVRS